MNKYEYTVEDANGDLVSGWLDANTDEEARTMAEAMGEVIDLDCWKRIK